MTSRTKRKTPLIERAMSNGNAEAVRNFSLKTAAYLAVAMITISTFGRGCLREEIAGVAAEVVQQGNAPIVKTLEDVSKIADSNTQAILNGQELMNQQLEWFKREQARAEKEREQIEDKIDRLYEWKAPE